MTYAARALGHRTVHILRQRLLDFGELPPPGGEFIRKGEFFALENDRTRGTADGLGKPMAIALPLLRKTGKNMLEAGDGTKRQRGDRQFGLGLGAGADQDGSVAITVCC